MRFFHPNLPILLWVCGVGCSDPDDQGLDAAADATTAIDSAIPGNGADAATDAAPTDCDLTRTAVCAAGTIRAQACAGPQIKKGAFCDDVFACAPDEAVAQAVMNAAPELVCAPSPGSGVCAAGAYACHWGMPGTIDNAEFVAICAVTVLPTPPEQVQCLIYI